MGFPELIAKVPVNFVKVYQSFLIDLAKKSLQCRDIHQQPVYPG